MPHIKSVTLLSMMIKDANKISAIAFAFGQFKGIKSSNSNKFLLLEYVDPLTSKS